MSSMGKFSRSLQAVPESEPMMFRLSLGHPHLHHSDGELLPPLLVVGGLSTEQWDVGDLGGGVVHASCAR